MSFSNASSVTIRYSQIPTSEEGSSTARDAGAAFTAAKTSIATRVGSFFKPVTDRYTTFRTPAPAIDLSTFLKEKADVGFTAADKLRFAYVDYRKAEGLAKVGAWFAWGGLGALVAGSMDKDDKAFEELEIQAKCYKAICKAEECFTKLVRRSPDIDKLDKAMDAFNVFATQEVISGENGNNIRTILNKKAGVESVTGTLLEYFAQFGAGDDMNSISEFFKDTSYSNTLQKLYDLGYRGVASNEELKLNKTRLEGLKADKTPRYSAEIRPLLISFEKGLARGLFKDDKNLLTLGKTINALTFTPEGLERRVKAEYSRNNRALEAYFNGETDVVPTIAGIPDDTMQTILAAADEYRAARKALADQGKVYDKENGLKDDAQRALDLYKAQTVHVALRDLAVVLDTLILVAKKDEESALVPLIDDKDDDRSSISSFTSVDSNIDAGIFQVALEDRILFKANEAHIQYLQDRIQATEIVIRKEAAASIQLTSAEYSQISTDSTLEERRQAFAKVDADKQKLAVVEKDIEKATADSRDEIKKLEASQAKLMAKQYSFTHADIIYAGVAVDKCQALQQVVVKGQELQNTLKISQQTSQQATEALTALGLALPNTFLGLPQGVSFDGTNFVLDITKDMYSPGHHESRKKALQDEFERTIAHIDTMIHINGKGLKPQQYEDARIGRIATYAVEQDRLQQVVVPSNWQSAVLPAGLSSSNMHEAVDAFEQLEKKVLQLTVDLLDGEPSDTEE